MVFWAFTVQWWQKPGDQVPDCLWWCLPMGRCAAAAKADVDDDEKPSIASHEPGPIAPCRGETGPLPWIGTLFGESECEYTYIYCISVFQTFYFFKNHQTQLLFILLVSVDNHRFTRKENRLDKVLNYLTKLRKFSRFKSIYLHSK